MQLTFSPMLMPARQWSATVAGDTLTIDGVALDFAPLPPGAILPRAAIACDWIAGDVVRDADGTLTVPLILPHGPCAPEARRFPQPIDAGDGPVDLPDFDSPEVAHAD